jgi:hypothetical protein
MYVLRWILEINSGYFLKELSIDFCVFCEVGTDFMKYIDALSLFDDPYHLERI